MKFESRTFSSLLSAVPALLLTLAYAGGAQAQGDAPTIVASGCTLDPNTPIFRFPADNSVSGLNPTIKSNPAGAWSASAVGSAPCMGGGSSWTCAGLTVALPTVSSAETTAFADDPGIIGFVGEQTLSIQAGSCAKTFSFRSTSELPQGWGDPHLTTVDGTHYDFQSAGEFTALREDGFELQTRQTAVPTATVPITNPYTEITHCVAIFTAVAAKLGSSSVTVQPSPGAEPDPENMQVRVNKKLVTLGNEPYEVRAGGSEKGALEGTITKLPAGAFEIRDVRGTQVAVASRYWSGPKVWYLNVSVFGTTAHQGTMGKLGERSWLPALPDGSSLGAKPGTDVERYQVLYEKFADAWRVTDQTSLFDYADYGQGTSTATYTRDEWPRNNPESCAIDGQTWGQPVTEQVAQQACANVVDATHKADCVFDVKITGETGFGKLAEVSQRFKPLEPGWFTPSRGDQKCPTCAQCCPECKDCAKHDHAKHAWWGWVLILLGVVQLALLVFLVIRATKKP